MLSPRLFVACLVVAPCLTVAILVGGIAGLLFGGIFVLFLFAVWESERRR